MSCVPVACAWETVSPDGAAKASRPWTWSERLTLVADPAPAESPTAEEPGVAYETAVPLAEVNAAPEPAVPAVVHTQILPVWSIVKSPTR